MGDARDRDWVRALDEVEDAVRRCLAVLDRYEGKFAELLAEHHGPTVRRHPVPEATSAGWDERLSVARGMADEVERLLAEQEAVWGRWQDSLSAWRRSVEQPPRAAAG
jgi:hypothetical protein